MIVLHVIKGVARGAEGAAAPPWHVTVPPWEGCKDQKLTKKRGKHKKKNDKKLLKIKNIDKK